MKRMGIVLGLLALVVGLGCGGSRATSPPPASAVGSRTRSLRDILGPLGAHQTPAQLAEVAAFIRRWERDPYGEVPENDTERSTVFLALAWLTESPDVSVSICLWMDPITGRDDQIGAITTPGATFGMAAYLIEHPGSDPNGVDVQLAGAQSAARWYEAGLRHGSPPIPGLEELRRQLASGELRAWYEENVRCH